MQVSLYQSVLPVAVALELDDSLSDINKGTGRGAVTGAFTALEEVSQASVRNLVSEQDGLLSDSTRDMDAELVEEMIQLDRYISLGNGRIDGPKTSVESFRSGHSVSLLAPNATQAYLEVARSTESQLNSNGELRQQVEAFV